ncbi:MAG TPA: Ldh family oxidoreductase [Bacteroidota bacterium]|nr:Ldh family oxidoreductase [Bacteroidota bacterium]
MKEEPKYFEPASLKSFALSVSKKYGLNEDDAEIFVDNLIDANLTGVDTHGLTRLSIYLKRIKLGLINPHPVMRFEQKFPVAAVLDADNGLGQIAGDKAIHKAIEMAETYGLGAVGVRKSQHFGALGYYCGKAVKREVICLAFTNAEPALPPWGSYEAYFGTNPMAMGVPSKDGSPIIIDLSTSIVARGKIISASKQKTPIPEGWALDPEGNPTTDPDKALAGSVLTMAGPKGYALAMMVDILSGVLSGSGYGRNVHSMYKDLQNPAEVGHFFLCMNIESFMPKDEFYKKIMQMKEEIKLSPKRQGVNEIRIPGENKAQTKTQRLKTGIQLSDDVLEELKTLARDNHIDWNIVSIK